MQKTLSALSVALLAPFVSAQNPGFCGTVGASIDVQALTTSNNGNPPPALRRRRARQER